MPTEYVQSATAFNIFRVKRCWSNKNVLLTLATKKKKKTFGGIFCWCPQDVFADWHDMIRRSAKLIKNWTFSMKLSSMNQNFQWLMLQNWGIEEEKNFQGYFWIWLGFFSIDTLNLPYHAWWYSCNKSLDRNNFICVPKAHRNKKIEVAEKKYVLSFNV